MIVLDTNMLSELMRARPAQAVVDWIAAQDAESLFATSITEAELRYGLAILPAGRRRDALAREIDGVFGEDFLNRVLLFDSIAAEHFATISARRRALGRPIAMADAMIAAIAAAHGFAVATRDATGFAETGVVVVDPFAEP